MRICTRKDVTAIHKRKLPLDAKTISNLFVVLVGITFFLGLSHFDLVKTQIGVLIGVLSPFILGFGVAYLLNSPMHFFERKVYKKIKFRRMLSIVTVYLLAIAVLAILLNLILPQVMQSAVMLGNNLQGYLNNLNALVQDIGTKFKVDDALLKDFVVSYNAIMTWISTAVSTALPRLFNMGVALGSGIISIVTALISSIYMLAGKDKLISQIKSIMYAFAPKAGIDKFLHGCHRANAIFVGFINGKLIDSAIIGVLCFVLCSILRIPFTVLISVIIGVTNIIPFFGPIIGAVPCVMILLIVDPWAALRFAVLVIALQQFDGNILGPKILGDSTGISAIWVLVAIVVGGGLFGFMGMLLGVPAFAVLYMVTKDVVTARLAAKGMDGNGRLLASSEVSPTEEDDEPKSN